MIGWLRRKLSLRAEGDFTADDMEYYDALARDAKTAAFFQQYDAVKTDAVELSVGFYARAFAAGVVEASDRVKRFFPSSVLASIVRDMMEQGESIWGIDITPEMQRIQRLHAVVCYGGANPRDWKYRAILPGPSKQTHYRGLADGVLHFRYASRSESPWRGQAPHELADLSTTAYKGNLAVLSQEMRTPVGSIITAPMQRDGVGEKKSDAFGMNVSENEAASRFHDARGRLLLIEQSASTWGDKGTPARDIVPHRMGPEPPAELITMLSDLRMSIANMYGVPSALLESQTSSTGQREAWRRFLHGSVQPVANTVADEIREKLGGDVSINFDALYASDIMGRARAYGSLINAKMDDAEARKFTGLE